jgi:hypothetical protein
MDLGVRLRQTNWLFLLKPPSFRAASRLASWVLKRSCPSISSPLMVLISFEEVRALSSVAFFP